MFNCSHMRSESQNVDSARMILAEVRCCIAVRACVGNVLAIESFLPQDCSPYGIAGRHVCHLISGFADHVVCFFPRDIECGRYCSYGAITHHASCWIRVVVFPDHFDRRAVQLFGPKDPSAVTLRDVCSSLIPFSVLAPQIPSMLSEYHPYFAMIV